MLDVMFDEAPVPFHWTREEIEAVYGAQGDDDEEEDGADDSDDDESEAQLTARVGQWYLVKPAYEDAADANGYKMKYWIGRARLCEKDADGWPGCRMQYFETKEKYGVHHPQRRNVRIKDLDFVWNDALTMQLPEGSMRQVRTLSDKCH